MNEFDLLFLAYMGLFIYRVFLRFSRFSALIAYVGYALFIPHLTLYHIAFRVIAEG